MLWLTLDQDRVVHDAQGQARVALPLLASTHWNTAADAGFPPTASQLEQAITTLDGTEDIVFLTDLLGGTPFRIASTMAMQKPGWEVITGTNLQLLLEMVMEREGLTSEAFRLQALECGHRGLTSLVDELGRCREASPVEEGI